MVNPILDGISLLLIHCPSYTDRLVNGLYRIPWYTTLNLCKLAEPLFAHIVVSSNDESPKPSKPWVSILKWSIILGFLRDSGVTTILGSHNMYIEWTNRPACKAGPVYPSAVADSMVFLTSSSASARLTKSSIASSNLSIPSLWMKSGETWQQTMRNWKWMEPLNIFKQKLMWQLRK